MSSGRPKGGYLLRDGTKVPGVTTITSRFQDSSALMFWAFEQGKACERGEIDSLYERRDQAADSGSLAHDLIQAWLSDEPFPDLSSVPSEIATQAKQSFDNALRWLDQSQIKIIYKEVPMVSEVYCFGGTPDAIGRNPQGQLCLLDWKTGKGCYPNYLWQLAAYQILWEENYPDKPITGGFHLINFKKDSPDFTHHFWTELEDAKEMFLLLRRAYDLDKKIKKRL